MTGNDLKNCHCPACNVFGDMQVVPYIDPYWQDTGIFKGLSIAFCNTCGFGYSVPAIADDTVNHFYTHIYRGAGSPFCTDFTAMTTKPASYDYRSLSQLILAHHFIEFKSGDSFVDIGPGGGVSFASAVNVLNRPKMFAVELSDGAAFAYKTMYGVETFSSIEKLIQHGYSPKIILSSHSLEHFKLQDLRIFLANIKNCLAANGVFVAEVPCVDMRIHSKMRSGDSPHFLFFSKESLKEILESSGFEILFLDTCAQHYDDWWCDAMSPGKVKVSRIKSIAREVFKKMPVSARQLIRKLYSKFNAKMIDFGRVDFTYGGDRTCLRVVARPMAS